MTDLKLTVNREINAPAEAVFNAWLDAETLAKFMMPMPDMSVPVAEADAKVGGRFKIVMRMGDQDLPHGGTYLEIVPHSKIVFTWESPYSVDGSTVTLTLSPAEGGKTNIELVHVKFPDEEVRDRHEGGWSGILAKLAEVIGT